MVQASPSFTHLKTLMKSKSSMGQVTIKCTNIWTKIASASAVIANKVVLQCIWAANWGESGFYRFARNTGQLQVDACWFAYF